MKIKYSGLLVSFFICLLVACVLKCEFEFEQISGDYSELVQVLDTWHVASV